MTAAEMQAWIDANMSGSPKISPETMRDFFFMIRDNFAHVDEPLESYTDQIADTDLDGNLEVTINHNLGTTVPEVILYDENDNLIYDEYCNIQVSDEDNLLLTFNDNIPVTGNGYYTIVVYYIIDSVPARYNEVFSSDFDSWTDDEPDDFTVHYPAHGSPTLQNDSDRAKLTKSTLFRITLTPDVALTENRNYRFTIKLDEGNLVITSGTKQYTLSTTGTFSFVMPAGDTSVTIRQGSATVAIIDSILIEEEI